MNDDFYDIRLRDLRFFERVAALGSITAAARELQLPKATASRWLAGLEARVGLALVKRTTRSVALTEAGEEFADRARELIASAKAARSALDTDEPTGLLRVSVPVPMGRMLAGPIIARFRRRLPRVRLEIRLQNERVDLIRDGVDLAIRGGPLTDSDLIVRRLNKASMWLYAAPRFRDMSLEEVPLIGAPGDQRILMRSELELELEAAVTVDDRTAVADALIWGAGMGLLPTFLGEPPRAEGALIRLSEGAVAAIPIHAVFHASGREDVRLQTLIEEIDRQLEQLF